MKVWKDFLCWQSHNLKFWFKQSLSFFFLNDIRDFDCHSWWLFQDDSWNCWVLRWTRRHTAISKIVRTSIWKADLAWLVIAYLTCELNWCCCLKRYEWNPFALIFVWFAGLLVLVIISLLVMKGLTLLGVCKLAEWNHKILFRQLQTKFLYEEIIIWRVSISQEWWFSAVSLC